jgi:hypothetical protein
MNYILNFIPKIESYIPILKGLLGKDVLQEEDTIIPLRIKENPIDFTTIQEGHKFYYDEGTAYSTNYIKIRITHKYGDVIFFKKVNNSDRKEYYMDRYSIAYKHRLFPIKVKILQGWTIKSPCDKIKYITK